MGDADRGNGSVAAAGPLANYEIQRRIGSGKFSVVYKARRLKDNSVCALKKVQVFDIKDAKAREKCLKEVKLLQELRHENIIRYHDSFFEEGVLFIVFEWAAGGDLKKVVREAAKPLDESVIWSYFTQISEGLRHMHDLRMMHRDIKPANVFITGSGTMKLGDMGLGRQLSQESVAAFSKVGTPLYMSPELLKGDGYDMKSDIWSLGCVLYEMAHLRSPFKTDDQNLYALFQRITSCEYPPLSDSYSPELRELVGRMVQIDTTARPGMEEVCKIAHINQKKFASRRNLHLVCEEMVYSLQLLNYNERFCSPRGCCAFSRLFFALGAGAVAGSEDAFTQAARPYAASGQAQFWTFIELVLWLLALAEGRQESAFDPMGMHELAVISDVIDRAKRLGCEADFPPARLKAGYGDAVCALLHDVSSCALRAQHFSWNVHDAAQSDVEEVERQQGVAVFGMGNTDSVAEGNFLEDSITGCAGSDEEERAGWGSGLEVDIDGPGGHGHEQSEIFSAMTPEQGDQWREETARLSAGGHLGAAKLALGKGGWRVSAIVLDKAVSKVTPGIERSIPALETLTETLSAELADLRRVEEQANSACAEQVRRLQAVSQTHSQLGAKHESAALSLADKAAQFAEVQDDLRDLRNQYEEASSGAHDSAPLRDIKRALRTVQTETATMSARIDWLREHLPSHRSVLAGGMETRTAAATSAIGGENEDS